MKRVWKKLQESRCKRRQWETEESRGEKPAGRYSIKAGPQSFDSGTMILNMAGMRKCSREGAHFSSVKHHRIPWHGAKSVRTSVFSCVQVISILLGAPWTHSGLPPFACFSTHTQTNMLIYTHCHPSNMLYSSFTWRPKLQSFYFLDLLLTPLNIEP